MLFYAAFSPGVKKRGTDLFQPGRRRFLHADPAAAENMGAHRRFQGVVLVVCLFSVHCLLLSLQYQTCVASNVADGETDRDVTVRHSPVIGEVEQGTMNKNRRQPVHVAKGGDYVRQKRRTGETEGRSQKDKSTRDSRTRWTSREGGMRRNPGLLTLSRQDLSLGLRDGEQIQLEPPRLRGVKRLLLGLVIPFVSNQFALGVILYAWGSLELLRFVLQTGITEVQQAQLNALVHGLRRGRAKALKQGTRMEVTDAGTRTSSVSTADLRTLKYSTAVLPLRANSSKSVTS